jgi:carbon storage regulator
MLILTRKPGQSVVIAGSIVVTVLDARNGKVRLGIQAPSQVPIIRQELVTNPLRLAVAENESTLAR